MSTRTVAVIQTFAPIVEAPPTFDVPVPALESDKSSFQSCNVSLQISYQTVPHVSSLFRDSKAISRAFRLLGRGMDLLLDKKFCIWNFSKGNSSRRASLNEKMEAGIEELFYGWRDPCCPLPPLRQV